MVENKNEGLLIRAEPLRWAQEVCRRMVDVVRMADGQRQGEAPDRVRELLCGRSPDSNRDRWSGTSGKGGSVKFLGVLGQVRRLSGVLLLCCVSRAVECPTVNGDE